MGRIIGAVIAGYLAMFLFVFLTFTAAYAAMGADGSFKPGTYEVSMQWIVASTVLGLLGAVIGGWICARIAGRMRRQAVISLAILILVLGIGSAIPVLMSDQPSMERSADVSNTEAMMNARTPAWIALVTPLIGVAGLFAGVRIAGGPNAP